MLLKQAILLSFIFYSISCVSQVVKKCIPVETEKISLALKLQNRLFIPDSTFITKRSDTEYLFNSVSIWAMDSVELNECLSQVLLPAGTDFTKATLAVLYYDLPVRSYDTIHFNRITGIGLYSYHNTHYYYRLFVKGKEVKELTTKITAIEGYPIYKIGTDIIFKRKSSFSIIELNKRIAGNYNVFEPKNILGKKVDKYLKRVNR